MGKHERLTGAERIAKRRATLRAQGLRLRQFWVPDVRDPDLLARIERDVAAINASREEADYLVWLDANHDELMASEPPYDWGGKKPE